MGNIIQKLHTITLLAAATGHLLPGFYLPLGVFTAVYTILGLLGEFPSFDFIENNPPEAFTGYGYGFIIIIIIKASNLSIYRSAKGMVKGKIKQKVRERMMGGGKKINYGYIWDIRNLFQKISTAVIVWSIFIFWIYTAQVIGFHILTGPTISNRRFGLWVGLALVLGTLLVVGGATFITFFWIEGYFNKKYRKNSERTRGFWILEILHFILQIPSLTGALLITWLVFFKQDPINFPERISVAIAVGIFVGMNIIYWIIKIVFKRFAWNQYWEWMISPEYRRGWGYKKERRRKRKGKGGLYSYSDEEMGDVSLIKQTKNVQNVIADDVQMVIVTGNKR